MRAIWRAICSRRRRQALAEAAGADDPETLRLPVGEEAFSDPHLNHLACQRVAATSRALATRLQGLVQASRMDRPGATWQGRTLLSRRLHRVGLGETRLFARPHRRPAPNTGAASAGRSVRIDEQRALRRGARRSRSRWRRPWPWHWPWSRLPASRWRSRPFPVSRARTRG
ncbi:MAG: hypothetical protein MZU95_16485 [Desulfomicrobium escambiense]|nr:hypothetical protein [Desulfomicrobium escambiense]